MAYIALAVGINGFGLVLPWLAITLLATVWLFVRPTSVLPSAFSTLAAIGSIVFLLASLRPEPGSNDPAIPLIALLGPIALLSIVSLFRVTKAEPRRIV